MRGTENWFARLTSTDRRQARRYPTSGLVAYYWDGAAPIPHEVRDVSASGLYMLTEQRWYPGTLVTISLHQGDDSGRDALGSLAVKAKVVRSGEDGVGFSFAPQARRSAEAARNYQPGADQPSINKFIQALRINRGQALVEYALILPVVFLLIVNLVNFAGYFFAWITVANAARAGAEYAILGGASIGAPRPPSAAQITAVITQDISSLKNRASLAVNICTNNNGTVSALAGTCTSQPADTEPSRFVLTSIDVTYTYKPFIPAGFKFPGLNVYVTIPPTTIHRRAVMRNIQ